MAGETTGHVSKNYPVRSVRDFVKRPSLAIKVIESIAESDMLSAQLLSGGYSAQGGSVRYMKDTSANRYPTDGENEDVFQIAEGAAYPEVHQYDEQDEAATIKFAGKMYVTFEDEERNQIAVVKRGFKRLTNAMVRAWDNHVVNEVILADPDIQSTAALAPWRAAATTADQILEDIFLAQEKVGAVDLDTGVKYSPTAIMMSRRSHTSLMLKKDIRDIREDANNAAYSGTLGRLAGLNIMVSDYMPDTEVWVVDTNNKPGGWADETPLMTKPLRRDEERDRYILQAKRLSVAFVTDAGAMHRITSVSA